MAATRDFDYNNVCGDQQLHTNIYATTGSCRLCLLSLTEKKCISNNSFLSFPFILLLLLFLILISVDALTLSGWILLRIAVCRFTGSKDSRHSTFYYHTRRSYYVFAVVNTHTLRSGATALALFNPLDFISTAKTESQKQQQQWKWILPDDCGVA